MRMSFTVALCLLAAGSSIGDAQTLEEKLRAMTKATITLPDGTVRGYDPSQVAYEQCRQLDAHGYTVVIVDQMSSPVKVRQLYIGNKFAKNEEVQKTATC